MKKKIQFKIVQTYRFRNKTCYVLCQCGNTVVSSL